MGPRSVSDGRVAIRFFSFFFFEKCIILIGGTTRCTRDRLMMMTFKNFRDETVCVIISLKSTRVMAYKFDRCCQSSWGDGFCLDAIRCDDDTYIASSSRVDGWTDEMMRRDDEDGLD